MSTISTDSFRASSTQPPSRLEKITQALGAQQHLHPRRSLTQAICRAAGDNLSAPAALKALVKLQLNGAAPIGRLRRTELLQLAGCIERQERAAAVSGT